MLLQRDSVMVDMHTIEIATPEISLFDEPDPQRIAEALDILPQDTEVLPSGEHVRDSSG